MRAPDPETLWQGGGLWAVVKPHGLPVHASPRVDSVLLRLQTKGGPILHPAHRLDAGTSGILILAQDEFTARQVGELFKAGAVHKWYLALVDGLPTWDHRAVDEPVDDADGFAREAFTRFDVLERGRTATLVSAFPRHGRYHQVRIHAAAAGHPVQGDRDHGGSAAPQLCLHAARVRFAWPRASNGVVDLRAPVLAMLERQATRAGLDAASLKRALDAVAQAPVERS